MGKTLLIRVPLKPARYGTIDSDAVHARFRGVLTATGRKIGGLFTEVRESGVDRSRIDLRWRGEGAGMRRADGHRGLYPGNTGFRLLERHDHVRELAEKDAVAIASVDAELAALAEQEREIRGRREALVKAAWRRAGKLTIGELEELAERKAVVKNG